MGKAVGGAIFGMVELSSPNESPAVKGGPGRPGKDADHYKIVGSLRPDKWGQFYTDLDGWLKSNYPNVKIVSEKIKPVK